MISAPEDYGLTRDETLGHAGASDPPAEFASYWTTFREEVGTLPVHWTGGSDDEGLVVIPSLRSVRVTARLSRPAAPTGGEAAPRGIVVTTHGSGATDDFPGEPEPWAEHGLATVRLRVRGYPPSTQDTDDLRERWILHDIDASNAWILRGAVADVVQAVRCARRHYGPDLPIALHGESLGGGLAVIAAAQLGAMEAPGGPIAPARLALALPSLGDWRWRAGRYCNGMGAMVNEALVARRDEATGLMDTLLLFDATLHARGIMCPTLAKLAVRDDVVPAPSAAAVFNAITSPPKWRFVTSYGHFDGGIAAARAHVRFERLHPVFLDPRRDPAEVGSSAEETGDR